MAVAVGCWVDLRTYTCVGLGIFSTTHMLQSDKSLKIKQPRDKWALVLVS